MNTVMCGRLLCLIVVVASALRCAGDSITGGDNPGPEDADPSKVGSVTLLPESLTVPVHETAQLTVIVRDTIGAVIANPQVFFSTRGLAVGTVDSTGLVTGLPGGCGVGTIIAQSRGVNSNTAIITVGLPSGSGCEDNPGSQDADPMEAPSEVGSVTLLPESLTVPVYDTAQLTVIVRDTTGAVIANPQVVFSVHFLMEGTVDSTGLVTGLPGGCGVGAVIARSGGVNSNTAVITVGSPSGAGCWDY